MRVSACRSVGADASARGVLRRSVAERRTGQRAHGHRVCSHHAQKHLGTSGPDRFGGPAAGSISLVDPVAETFIRASAYFATILRMAGREKGIDRKGRKGRR